MAMNPHFVVSDNNYLPCPKCREKEAERLFLYPFTVFMDPTGKGGWVGKYGVIQVSCVRCKYILAMLPPADSPEDYDWKEGYLSNR